MRMKISIDFTQSLKGGILKNNFFSDPIPSSPCSQSPCGPNSLCRAINGQAVCSCIQGYIGSPPLCRPECTTSSECSLNQACINQKCKDPCVGACGVDAVCKTINHNPICQCAFKLTGDPFIRCIPTRKNFL